MTCDKINEVREKILQLVKGDHFDPLYDNFSIDQWRSVNAIREYLNQEIKTILYKGDIYFEDGYRPNFLQLRDEYGNEYSFGDYIDLYDKEYIQAIEGSDTKRTFIKYHKNGNIAGISQSIKTDYEVISVGIRAKYAEDGSIIEEINLEDEFHLDSDQVIQLLKREKGNNIGYNNIKRYLNTNYGKLWEITYAHINEYREYKPIKVYISDSSKTFYNASDFIRFTKAEFEKLYGNVEIEEIEERENKKILVVEDLNFSRTINK